MRTVTALLVLCALAVPARAQDDAIGALVREARQLARAGRGLEARAQADRAATAAGNEFPAEEGIRHLALIALTFSAWGDPAGARRVLRTRTRRICDLARVSLPLDTPAAELGAALAKHVQTSMPAATRRVVFGEAVRLLRRGAAPELGIALAGLGREKEAWPILVAGARGGPRVAECRAALADSALRRGRLDLAARVLRPRADLAPRVVAPILAELTQALEAGGQAPRAYELAAAWLAAWPADVAFTDRLPTLRTHARLARDLGHHAVALDALLSLGQVPGELTMARGAIGDLVALVGGAAQQSDAARHAIYTRLTNLPPSSLIESPLLLETFSELAEQEGQLEHALTIWQTADAGTLGRGMPWLSALATRLDASKDALAPVVRHLADLGQAPGLFMVEEDRAHPPDTHAGQIILRFGPDHVLVDLRTGRILGAQTQVLELNRFAAILGRVFSDYPADFPGKLDMLRFTLNRQPLDTQHAVAAWCNSQIPAIDIHLDHTTTDQGWYECLHHEIGHMIDYRITAFGADSGWDTLNPAGFAYLGNHDTPLPNAIPAGVTTRYSATDHLEDKADLWEELMVRPDALVSLGNTDPAVLRKATLWRSRAAQWLPSMNAAWFQAKRAHP